MAKTGAGSFSIAILAGGQSRRMGRHKALLEVGGVVVLRRVIEAVTGLSTDLFLVANCPQLYQAFHLPIKPDIIPGKSALGGIYTAVARARYDWVLVLACDMPLLDPAVITFLAGYLNTRADIVSLLVETHPEPLHAFYKKTCLPVIEKKIMADALKIRGVFDEVRVQYVEEAALATVSSNLDFLLNMNTPQDLATVRRLVEAKR